MKDYLIATKTNSGQYDFLTQAKTPQKALRNLLERSFDFGNIKTKKTIKIKIKEMK